MVSLTSTDVVTVSDELHTVRDWLRFALSQFSRAGIHCGHGTDSYWDEAVQLITQTLHLPHDNNAYFLDARLLEEEKFELFDRIHHRIEARIPVAYLTGEAWFMGLPFNVDRRVLIPRSPLAEFLAKEGEPWLNGRPVRRILDLCTGSGCIGIAAALQFPEAEVDLADISRDALAVARENIARHGLEDRVRTVESDLFAQLDGEYDLILSNPPYVDAEDLAAMPPEYRHEPRLGLAAGEDGLEVVRRILDEAPDWLSEHGVLVAEVGNTEAALAEARPELPFLWLEFEHGGHGVFLLEASDLRALRDDSDQA